MCASYRSCRSPEGSSGVRDDSAGTCDLEPHRASLGRRIYLACECGVLFAVLPVMLYLFRTQLKRALIPLLFLLGITAFILLRRNPRFPRKNLFRLQEERHRLKSIFRRLLVGASALFLAVLMLKPDVLLAFPRTYFGLWCLIMIFYPLVSVYPQELIFRAFFFHRYAPLFARPFWMIAASGLAFGLAHLVFGNWVAVVLSTLGGFLFAGTYHRSRSLVLTSIEHGLWGDFIFTVGLGIYFYSGAIQ